jgi:formate dehydrogenase subunit gamma
MGDGERPHESVVVKQILDRRAGEEGALLEILIDVQEALGYVPPSSLATIAQALNLSRADVHGVVTFYHDLRTSPPGRCVVKLCRAEACQAVGAEALVAHAERTLGLRVGESNGEFGLESVYCLGACATGPAMLVDGQLVARVTPACFDSRLTGKGAA